MKMKTIYKRCCFHCFLCLAVISKTFADVFSSVYRLQILAKEETRLFDSFRVYTNYYIPDNSSSSRLQRLFEELEAEVDKRSCNVEYAGNPLNIIHLLDRCLNVWPNVMDTIFCETCLIIGGEKAFNSTYHHITQETGIWPTEYDLKAAIRNLLRLRITYLLDVEKLIQGVILDSQSTPLTWPQVMLIIEEAEESEWLEEVILWCDTVLSLLPVTTTANETMVEMSVKQIKARIYAKADFMRNAADLLREYSDTGTLSVREDFQYYDSNSQNITEFFQEWPFQPTPEEQDDVEKQLCRQAIKTSGETSRLSCYMSDTVIPFYKGKSEEMNLDPKVIVFHDVISDTEIQFLKRRAVKNFARSGLQNYGEGVGNNDNVRVSCTEWVSDDNPVTEKLSRRIKIITGLDTTLSEELSSAEEYQVVNYGTGGFFNPHIDNLFCPLWGPVNQNDAYYLHGSGDRIATWMFYISDVKAGGATILPNIKTRIPVIKGAAAFWYNLLPNGEIDYRVYHGGCPVLLGSKWISNKWIRETGQMHRRRCSLHYNDTL